MLLFFASFAFIFFSCNTLHAPEFKTTQEFADYVASLNNSEQHSTAEEEQLEPPADNNLSDQDDQDHKDDPVAQEHDLAKFFQSSEREVEIAEPEVTMNSFDGITKLVGATTRGLGKPSIILTEDIVVTQQLEIQNLNIVGLDPKTNKRHCLTTSGGGSLIVHDDVVLKNCMIQNLSTHASDNATKPLRFGG